MDAPRARDHAVAEDLLLGHPEVVALVNDELVELGEAALVEQQLDPLPRRLLAGRVLSLDPLRPTAELRGLVASAELLEAIAQVHDAGYRKRIRGVVR